VGIIPYLIQGKEGGIQVLAGLALSSQTVAFIIEDPGATKGGSCRLSMKMSVDELAQALSMSWAVDELAIDEMVFDEIAIDE
jgi:hypothetical protein